MNEYRDLLPWYANQTLDAAERQIVEGRLQEEAAAAMGLRGLQRFSAAVRAQKPRQPSREAEARLFAKIRRQQARRRAFRQWAWGAPLAVLFFALLWLALQPGAQLQWSLRGERAAAFRIYRAPVGSAEFELIAEIPAQSGQHSYQYRDLQIFPGKAYHYALEIVDRSGEVARSPVVANNPWEALALYAAVALTSFVLAFGVVTLGQELRFPPGQYAAAQ